jgi:hypothetical protein
LLAANPVVTNNRVYKWFNKKIPIENINGEKIFKRNALT